MEFIAGFLPNTLFVSGINENNACGLFTTYCRLDKRLLTLDIFKGYFAIGIYNDRSTTQRMWKHRKQV